MKNLFKTLGLAAIVMAMAACTDRVETNGGYGEIVATVNTSPEVSLKDVATNDKIYTLDGLTLPSSSDFSFEVISTSDNSSQSWDSITEFASEKRYFPAGEYTLKVAYGDPTGEGFDITPYFAGQSKIEVMPRTVSKATISARIGHSVVAVECTDNFKMYFPSYDFKVTTLAGGEFNITLPMSQTLFIRPQQFAIDCIATKQTGEQITLPRQIFAEVNPQTRYTVKFDVAEAGSVTIHIKLNDNLIESIAIDTELNDDALPE